MLSTMAEVDSRAEAAVLERALHTGEGGVGGEGGRAQNNAARKPARPSPFNHLRTSTISGIGTPLPWASLAHRLMAVEASVEDA